MKKGKNNQDKKTSNTIEDIEEVKYIIKLNEEDDFNTPHTYVERIYILAESTLTEIRDMFIQSKEPFDEIKDFRYETSIGMSFVAEKHLYINIKSAFTNIYELGKYFKTNYSIKSIDDLGSYMDLFKEKNTHNLGKQSNTRKNYIKIIKWVQNNFYPYYNFNKDNFPITLVKDSVRIYTFYEIHKYLIKIKKNIDYIVAYPNIYKELNYLSDLLIFINFNDWIQGNFGVSNIVNLPEHYNSIDEVYKLATSPFKDKNKPTEEEILKFCELVRITLIEYVLFIMSDNNEDCFVTKQKIFFEPSTEEYRALESSNSLIGIVYNNLLFNLTSNKEALNRVICEYSPCTNELVKKGNRKYCKNTECQKARNRKKNHDRYYR